MSKTVHFTLTLLMPVNIAEGQLLAVVSWLESQVSLWNKDARSSVGFANESDDSIDGSITLVTQIHPVKSGQKFRTEFRPAWEFKGQSRKRMYISQQGPIDGRDEPVPLLFYQQLRDNLKRDKRRLKELLKVTLQRKFSYSEKESLLYLGIDDR